MAVAQMQSGAVVLAEREPELDKLVAQTCLTVLNTSTLEEIKRGKEIFNAKVLNSYEWTYSSSFLVSNENKVESDLARLGRAKKWNEDFTCKVQDLASLTIKDTELKIKFCTESESGIEIAMIASCKDAEGNYYVKVLRVDHAFCLAPDVKINTLTDSEPVTVKLTTGFGLFGFAFNHEYTKQVGEKTTQRIEKVAVPQKVSGDEFSAMHKYLEFKLCQAAIRPHMSSITLDDKTRDMLEWSP